MNLASRIISKTKRIATEQIGQSVFSGLVAGQIKGNYILMYHGVTSDGSTQFNKRHVAYDCFKKQVAFLKKHFSIISLSDFFKGQFNQSGTNFVLTFDDGYLNNFTYARPVLEEYQCPATFFITGLNEVGDRILWADYVNIASVFTNEEVRIDDEKFVKKSGIYYSAETGKSIYEIIKNERPAYDYKLKVKAAFGKAVDVMSIPNISEYRQLMSDEQIKETSASKFITIGSHGYYHNNLGVLNNNAACDELGKSKRYLENLTQKETDQLAYPDGSYTLQLTESAHQLGFEIQLAADRYMYDEARHPAYIKRRYGIYTIDSCLNQVFTAINA